MCDAALLPELTAMSAACPLLAAALATGLPLVARDGTLHFLPPALAPDVLARDPDDETMIPAAVPCSGEVLHAAVRFWISGQLDCANHVLIDLCELAHWAASDTLADAAAKRVAAGLCNATDEEAEAFIESLGP